MYVRTEVLKREFDRGSAAGFEKAVETDSCVNTDHELFIGRDPADGCDGGEQKRYDEFSHHGLRPKV